MVFSTVPVYLDPPNWNQQQHHLPLGGSIGVVGSEIHQLPTSLATAPEPPEAGSMAAAAGSVKPGSMADRARLAKLPQPAQGLKCPRCDSSNTKFCYFNNYSLSQPRHFCKTCRRYWTCGGALRNVPVGGGCRRNKRSKSSGSSAKSAAAAAAASSAGGGTSSSSSTATGGGGLGAIANSSIPAPAHLSFMTSLHHHPFADHFGGASNLGLNFAGLSHIDSLEYQMAGSNTGMGLEQWRHPQQFPFFGGLGLESHQPPPGAVQPASGLYSFEADGGGGDGLVSQVLPKVSGMLTQQPSSVKMENANAQGLNLPRQYLGLQANDQYWGGGGGSGGPSSGTAATGAWTGNLSNFSS